MDLEMYLLLERRNLELDRRRLLSAREGPTSEKIDSDNKTMKDCNNRSNTEETLDNSPADETKIVSAKQKSSENDSTPKTENVVRNVLNENNEPVTVDTPGSVSFTKSVKEWNNQQEFNATYTKADSNDKTVTKKQNIGGKLKRSNEDDMEQWVSDTFYSYFPGFNNEYQKRQDYLRNRQRENQLNFLKHQKSHPPLPTLHSTQQAANTARSNSSTATNQSTATHATDKTDLEIIVNNPHYQPPKHSNANVTRPGTARYRLLQDLRHTNLSPLNAEERNMEYNRPSAVELETARKQEYQRELIQQIEEKRRSIELLRANERKQEEALTRRLQEQLKAIQLEEQLEKEKMLAEKLRYDADRNRVMREQLLEKLDQDAKLLRANKNNNNILNKTSGKNKENSDSNQVKNMKDLSDINNKNHNKVYKYFSNSARREYRRGKPLPTDEDLDLDLAAADIIERECFHLSEKVCPMCDGPLKHYESCCLRCQRKLPLKLNAPIINTHDVICNEMLTKQEDSSNSNRSAILEENNRKSKVSIAENVQDNEESTTSLDDDMPINGEKLLSDGNSFALICHKCERMYTLCQTCLAKRAVCRACHRKLNVCMNCRRTLCTSCLDEIATGRDTERSHINESEDQAEVEKAGLDGEGSFRLLEVQYAAQKSSSDETDFFSDSIRVLDNKDDGFRHIKNNLHEEFERPPYSMNVERNSVFYPDRDNKNKSSSFEYQQPKVMDKELSFDLDSTSSMDEQTRIEHVRRETDKRLSRYLENYGDVALCNKHRSKSESHHRGTQTTPIGVGRRDVVLREEHNLSMPLLREMPKMTRDESRHLLDNVSLRQRKIEDLKRKWEIPAVQKFIISSESPPVLTQVGAIRKQLQAERIVDY